jgi:hypothetical protein
MIHSQFMIANLINMRDVVDYIVERQNEDGGYTFCRQTASNAQDTYYALRILRMFGVKPVKTDRTVLFLQRLQHEDGNFDSVKIAYYVIHSLSELGSTLIKPSNSVTRSFDAVLRGLRRQSTYVGIVSEIENLHLAVELFAPNFPINVRRVIKQVLSIRNSDGSFGSRRHSRIASTYHVLEILKILNYDYKSTEETLRWVRRCEISNGGFVSSPDVSASYLEDTYFGVEALKALHERLRYPKETLKYIVMFQNLNGGFRRSIFLGISDFESTYHAISCIESILTI